MENVPVLCAGPLAYYGLLVQHPITFDVNERFIKQTYRNRYRILGANGVITLTVPVDKNANKTPLNQVLISNIDPWQANHWKSLVSAYQSSPFFEYYDYLFEPLFQKQYTLLIDFLIDMHAAICACLEIHLPIEVNTPEIPFEAGDTRHFYQAKNPNFDHISCPEYQQVFSYNAPFQAHLSVLDVLFNLGPESLAYLQQISSSS
jgi:hypothetical protein